MEEEMSSYRTIVADPPWDVKRPGGWSVNKDNRPQPYPTMTTAEMMELPVAALADESAWLFVWTVNAFVEDCYRVVRAWGFRPVTLLTWCKQPHGVGPGSAFPTTTEFILFARRGTEGLGRLRLTDSSWFTWPRGRQSQKPEAFLDLIESGFPAPRLEMFARTQRLGWDTWGNEALEHVVIG
jgi:N6-adenosine-specific RNA methylase IME4